MKQNIFVNLTRRRPEATESGQAYTFPDFIAGDTAIISTRFTQVINGTQVEIPLNIRSAKLSLGLVDTAPASGFWSLKVGSGASTSANTTPLLLSNINAAALAGALNNLDVVTGSLSPAKVTRNDGSFFISFGDNAATSLTVVSNTLRPVSFARIRERATGGGMSYEVRLMQAPLATSAIPFVRELPPSPVITTVQDGGQDPSGTTLWPEVQKLSISPSFRGTFILRHGDYAKSPILDPDISADDLQTALVRLFAADGYSPEVRDAGDGEFLIIFNDSESMGIDISPLVVQVFNAPIGDPTFYLDLNTREVFDALNSANPREDCVLELEAEIVSEGEDAEDLGNTGYVQTLFQVPVILRRELQWDGLTSSATLDWQRPPEARDYIPFTSDQVLTGQQQAFSSVIGDGEATAFVIDHNLDSELIQVVVRENASPGRLLTPDEYAVEITNDNSLKVTFPEAPESNEFAAYVVAIGPESVFQSHTHTIGQITNLQNILDDYGTRMEAVEALVLPGTIKGIADPQSISMETIIPETSEILFVRGIEDMAEMFSEIGVDPAALNPRRAPFMLPAVHDGSTSALTDPLPAPSAGDVWEASERVLIPGGGQIRGAYVDDGDFVASDGRLLYPANHEAGTNSYYPAAFERTLFAMAINENMMAVKRRLEILWGVQAQLIHANCKAQWVMTLDIGTFSEETDPATLGLNLEYVNWTTRVFSHPIILSRLLQSHYFGVRILRSGASEFKLDQQIYNWEPNNDKAPASGNFAIRARLTRFDTENRNDPRGYVAWRLIGSIKTDNEGNQTIAPAKAIIQ